MPGQQQQQRPSPTGPPLGAPVPVNLAAAQQQNRSAALAALANRKAAANQAQLNAAAAGGGGGMMGGAAKQAAAGPRGMSQPQGAGGAVPMGGAGQPIPRSAPNAGPIPLPGQRPPPAAQQAAMRARPPPMQQQQFGRSGSHSWEDQPVSPTRGMGSIPPEALDAQGGPLIPCRTCGRSFNPQAHAKHVKVGGEPQRPCGCACTLSATTPTVKRVSATGRRPDRLQLSAR